MAMQGKLIIISAPSGAGKTTLVNELIARVGRDYPIERVITYTSRKPRAGEVNGSDYYFIPAPVFDTYSQFNYFMAESGVYGASYGTARSVLCKLERGISLVMVLDLQGAREVKKVNPALSLWLTPPSLQALEERLTKRGTEDAQEQSFRLKLAQGELACVSSKRDFDHVIVNDDQAKALDELEAIVRDSIERQAKPREALEQAYIQVNV